MLSLCFSMRIPFALHHRIPRIKYFLEERDLLRSTNQALTLERDQLLQELVVRKQRIPDDAPNLVYVDDPAMGVEAARILQILKPMNVIGASRIRAGGASDGGYIMIDRGLNFATMYSFGINGDVRWDLEMAERGCQIFQYDHTIDALPEEHPNFHWFRQGIAAVPTSDGIMTSIGEILKAHRHEGCRDITLKMDIEDSEWEVFEHASAEDMDHFSQILVEVHKVFTWDYTEPADREHMARRRAVLEKIDQTHQLVHLHANNYGSFGLIGGVSIPDVLELTYVRRRGHEFEPCDLSFPTDVDRSNKHGRADFYFGMIGR